EVQRDYAELKARLQGAERELLTSRIEAQVATQNLDALRDAAEDRGAKLSAALDDLAKAQAEVASLQQALKAAQAALASADRRSEQLTEQRDAIEQRLSEQI